MVISKIDKKLSTRIKNTFRHSKKLINNIKHIRNNSKNVITNVKRKTAKITKKAIRKSKYLIINLQKSQIEFLLLFSILVNYFILFRQNKISKKEIKTRIMDLLKTIRNNNKFISKDTTDTELENMYINISKYINLLLNKLYPIKHLPNGKIQSNSHSKHSGRSKNLEGGFYFKSLEDKGEKPITGNDLAKLLDEIQQFIYNAKYTAEGKFLQDTDTLISMFRGDVNQFKAFLQYRIFPKYYTPYPPFIKWDGFKEAFETKKWEDIPDYLLAYQSYLRSRDEYDVERGLKSPAILQRDLYTGFYNKLATTADTEINKFIQYRNKFQGNYYPIAVPV